MRRNGFTLIEILIAVIIFTMAILMSSGAIVMSSRVNTRVEAMRQVQDETRSIAEYIDREIAGAKSVTVGSGTLDCVTTVCSSITLHKINESGDEVTEGISQTFDNRGIKITNSAGGQIITTDKILIRKLQFTPVSGLTQPGQFAVKVSLAMEEAPLSGSNYNKSGVQLVNGMLGKPIKMELRFVSGNIGNF